MRPSAEQKKMRESSKRVLNSGDEIGPVINWILRHTTCLWTAGPEMLSALHPSTSRGEERLFHSRYHFCFPTCSAVKGHVISSKDSEQLLNGSHSEGKLPFAWSEMTSDAFREVLKVQ